MLTADSLCVYIMVCIYYVVAVWENRGQIIIKYKNYIYTPEFSITTDSIYHIQIHNIAHDLDLLTLPDGGSRFWIWVVQVDGWSTWRTLESLQLSGLQRCSTLGGTESFLRHFLHTKIHQLSLWIVQDIF